MNKYWLIPNSTDIVIIRNRNIHYGKSEPKLTDFKENSIIPKHFNVISIGEIEKIENKEKNNYIKLFHNQHSATKLYIKNKNIKLEIIDFIKENLTEFKYKKDFPTNIEYAKEYYILIIVLLFSFFFSLHFAIGISNGENFKLSNLRIGILHFYLYVSKIGVLNLAIVFILSLSLIIYLLRKKLQTKGFIETLTKHKN